MIKAKFNTQLLYLFAIAITSIDFFSVKGLVNSGRTLYFGLFFLAIPFILLGIINARKKVFASSMKLLLIAILLSSMACFVYWKQGIVDTIVALLFSMAGYFLYFDFLSKKINYKNVEKAIVAMGLLYVFCFFISLVIYPNEIFYNPYTDPRNLFQGDDDRGGVRIMLNGNGFLFLVYFFAINKAKETVKPLWVLVAAIAYICILLTLTRIYIFSTTIISIIYLLRGIKLKLKIGMLTILTIVIIGIMQLNVVQKLIQYSNNEAELIDDYIRLQEAEYFFSDFQPSIITKIFGNGFERTNKSAYGIKVGKQQEDYNYYISDIGILGLYIYLGALGIVAFVMIVYKGVIINIPKTHIYLKLFIIFIILTCFTTNAFFSLDFLMPIVFVLYIYEKIYIKSQHSKNHQPQTFNA